MSTQDENATDTPTREQVVEWYTEQIELHKLRRELAELQRDIAAYDAEKMEAIAKSAYFTGKLQPEQESHDEEESPKERKLRK